MTPGECVRVRVAVPDAPGFCPPSLTVQVSQTKDSLILGEPALGTGCLPKVVGFHPELGLAPPFKSAHCSPIPQSAQGLASAYKPSPSANHSTHLHPTTRQLVNHPQTQLPSPALVYQNVHSLPSFFFLPHLPHQREDITASRPPSRSSLIATYTSTHTPTSQPARL